MWGALHHSFLVLIASQLSFLFSSVCDTGPLDYSFFSLFFFIFLVLLCERLVYLLGSSSGGYLSLRDWRRRRRGVIRRRGATFLLVLLCLHVIEVISLSMCF